MELELIYNQRIEYLNNQRFEDILKKEKFIDEYFPLSDVSIGNIDDEKDLDSTKNKYEWIEFNKLYQKYYIVNCISEENDCELLDDILQGELGDCYFLCALSALAEIKSRVKNLISCHNLNQQGVYEVIAYVSGRKIKILLDNYIPCIKESNNKYYIAFTGLDEKSLNIWPILMEKAWAKINLSYGNIKNGSILDALQFLTPCPIEILKHDRDKNIFEKMLDADKKNFVICSDVFSNCGEKANILEKMGLISNHAYTVISIHKVTAKNNDEVDLLKVRNPWGALEWNGDWSDNSDCWTPELRKELIGESSNDGIFFINFKDFCKFFSTTFICKYHDDYIYKWIDLNFNFNQSFIKFIIKKKSHGYFIVNQKSSRVYRNITGDQEFMNPFCSLTLNKLEDSKIILQSTVCGREDRLFLEANVEPGEYLICLYFPSKIKEDSLLVSFEEYENWLLNKDYDHKYIIGFYSPLLDEEIIICKDVENNNSYKHIYPASLIDFCENDSSKSYFYQEGEPESWRVMTIDTNNESVGFLMYKNHSNGIIRERLHLNKLVNFQLVSFYCNKGNLKIKNNYIDIYEDIFESDLVKSIRKLEDYNSKINLQLNNDEVFLEIDVAPHNYLGVIFIKLDENSEINGISKIKIDYMIDYLWSERKFLSSKNRLFYENNEIDIFESIIKHTGGIIFKYKNKTEEYGCQITINVSNCRNLKYSNKFDSIKNSIIVNENSYIIELSPKSCNFVELLTIDDREYNLISDIFYKISIVA